MKRITFIIFCCVPLLGLAQPQVKTTPFTTDWLNATNALQGRIKLGVTTNITTINPITTNTPTGTTNFVTDNAIGRVGGQGTSNTLFIPKFRAPGHDTTRAGDSGWIDNVGSNLMVFHHISSPQTNYFDLFIGDFTPGNPEQGVNIGDWIVRMTGGGFLEFQFTDQDHAFQMQYGANAFVLDGRDAVNDLIQRPLWDQHANQFGTTLTVEDSNEGLYRVKMSGTNIVINGPYVFHSPVIKFTNNISVSGTITGSLSGTSFFGSQFTNDNGKIRLITAAATTNLAMYGTPRAVTTFFLGNDTYTPGRIDPQLATLAIGGDLHVEGPLTADVFVGTLSNASFNTNQFLNVGGKIRLKTSAETTNLVMYGTPFAPNTMTIAGDSFSSGYVTPASGTWAVAGDMFIDGGNLTADSLTGDLTGNATTATTASSLKFAATNPAPAGFVVGATVPAVWFAVTNGTTKYLVPGFAP